MSNTIEIKEIDAADRLRPVDPAHAALIAASIEDRGLITPIAVRRLADGSFRLVAGAHRLAALAALGHASLTIGTDVIIRDADDLDAQIDEIDENLARHELNALDRALSLAKRRALYEEKHRTDKRGGDRRSQKFRDEINSASCGFDFSQRFTLEVAGRVGLSEDTISRALSLARKLNPDAIPFLRGTRFERNQQELLALSELAQDDQRAVAEKLATREAKTVTQGCIALGLKKAVKADPQLVCLNDLRESWLAASTETRTIFLADIGAAMLPKAKA